MPCIELLTRSPGGTAPGPEQHAVSCSMSMLEPAACLTGGGGGVSSAGATLQGVLEAPHRVVVAAAEHRAVGHPVHSRHAVGVASQHLHRFWLLHLASLLAG